MTEYLNTAKLSDKNVGQYQKLKTTINLPKAIYKKIDIICKIIEAPNRNIALESAISFYFSYLTNALNQEYLCDIYGNKINAEIKILSDRMAKLQFKSAVEMDMLTRILANDLDMSKETYNKLRKTAVDSVKESHGSINIFDAANNE